jgi:hypothetical protein
VSASSPKHVPAQAELIAYLRNALAKSARPGSEVTRAIVEMVIHRVIAAFHSDSRLPAKTALQWEALLADAACRRPSKRARSDIHARREHSRKPELFHCFEQHCSGLCVDLFARPAAAQSPGSSSTQARSTSTPSSIFSVPTLEAFRATRRPPERHSGHK